MITRLAEIHPGINRANWGARMNESALRKNPFGHGRPKGCFFIRALSGQPGEQQASTLARALRGTSGTNVPAVPAGNSSAASANSRRLPLP